MNWSYWKELIPEYVVQAFCRTLFHSLWEGFLMAIAGAILILLTKKASSSLRYNLLSTLFFLYIATVALTFYLELDSSGPVSANTLVQTSYQSSSGNSQWIPLSGGTVRLFDAISNFLNTHAFLVVSIWFLIFSFRCFSLLTNIGYTYRIRRHGIHPAECNWQKKMNQLARRLGISRQIQLLESELVRVPVVVGFFKPIILFPFSMISNLPVQQVEAVLLHELAHIKRRDLLVNLFQHMAEILFSFNPAVIWISAQIRNERENCCDDIALSQIQNKTPFIHALIAFQEYNMNAGSYSVGFPGRGNQLLNRVLRIVNNNNKTLTNMEKIFLATGLVAIGLVTITFTQAENSKPGMISKPSNTSQTIYQASATTQVRTDSIPEAGDKAKAVERNSFLFSRDGKSYRGTRINGKVTELYVDGQKIPESKLGDYQKIFEEVDRDLKQQAEDLEAKEADLKAQKEAVVVQELAIKSQAEAIAKSQADMQRVQAEQNAKLAYEIKSKQDQLVKVMQDVQVAEINEKLTKVQTQSAININGITYVPANVSVSPANPKTITTPPIIADAPGMNNNEPIFSIIRDLRTGGIISDDVNLSFTLNSSKLIVNGTTQPAEIHKKFAKKYIHSSKDHVIYSSSKNSTRTDIYMQ